MTPLVSALWMVAKVGCVFAGLIGFAALCCCVVSGRVSQEEGDA